MMANLYGYIVTFLNFSKASTPIILTLPPWLHCREMFLLLPANSCRFPFCTPMLGL